MNYAADTFARSGDRPFEASDITMVVAVRAHADNPWVAARLAMLRDYYAPSPVVHVVDFGSSGEYRDALERECATAGFHYSHVDDSGTFSLARARNVGASCAETDLIFFTDIDCLGERELFAHLASFARAIELGARIDQIVPLPAYHLGTSVTADVEAAADHGTRAACLARAFVRAAYARPGVVADFVAPYSNVFLCHRAFFDLTGGFNESFRGHGSEDFEYLLRFALIAGRFPLPRDPGDDRYGPTGIGFYATEKPYRGFRRLFELMAFQAETAGLRVAHLDHAQANHDSWRQQGDRRRESFERQVAPFLADRRALVGYDWLPRARVATVDISAPIDLEQLLPLRVAGYRLEAGAANTAFEGLAPRERTIVDACTRLRTPPDQRFDLRSYAAGRLAVGSANAASGGDFGHGIDRPRADGDAYRRLRKLARDPARFLEESRFPALRWLGRRLGK